MDSEHGAPDGRMGIFCLHHLGGSAREWRDVASALETVRCIALDLPGFGDAPAGGYTVAEMATTIAEAIRQHAPARWMLAGHSMGAKVAAVIAHRIETGSLDLPGLAGLILVAGSPPSPEPMPDEQRREMLAMFARDRDADRSDARAYVAQNSGPMDDDARRLAETDVLRMERAAWLAWLERGSREDWSDRIGTLAAPALVVAGADDENLGPTAQKTLMSPHFSSVRLVTFEGAKHLLPLERPADLARAIDDHVRFVTARSAATVPDAYLALIDSDRVSANTRSALLSRARPDDPAYEARAIDAAALVTLRAVCDRVVPQRGERRIDLAARIDAELHDGGGDGWRFAALPPDTEAYRLGLETLDAVSRRRSGRAFHDLDTAGQDGLLTEAAESRLDGDPFDAARMRAWFEDLRADAVKAYLGHPATLARIGYSGIAYGGDGEPKSGFARFAIGEREAWEPVAAPGEHR